MPSSPTATGPNGSSTRRTPPSRRSAARSPNTRAAPACVYACTNTAARKPTSSPRKDGGEPIARSMQNPRADVDRDAPPGRTQPAPPALIRRLLPNPVRPSPGALPRTAGAGRPGSRGWWPDRATQPAQERRQPAGPGAARACQRPGTPPPAAEPSSGLSEPANQDRVVALRLEVGEDDAHGLADDAPAIDHQAVLAAEVESGGLQVEQLLRRAVDGDLLLVPLPAARHPIRDAARPLAPGLPHPVR